MMKTDFNFNSSGSFEIDSDGNLNVKDFHGNQIYYKDLDGSEYWWEYDENNQCIHYNDSHEFEASCNYSQNDKLIHYNDSNGCERWYNSVGDDITKKEFDMLNQS